ncbi:hypothetical protein O3P69_020470 [Scylla paramamosain]|uniref:Uncharacterized protein n=1 Tax=Scylla paramamosain TaxID=85552 RepID=A0AAW0TL82_SCYPA
MEDIQDHSNREDTSDTMSGFIVASNSMDFTENDTIIANDNIRKRARTLKHQEKIKETWKRKDKGKLGTPLSTINSDTLGDIAAFKKYKDNMYCQRFIGFGDRPLGNGILFKQHLHGDKILDPNLVAHFFGSNMIDPYMRSVVPRLMQHNAEHEGKVLLKRPANASEKNGDGSEEEQRQEEGRRRQSQHVVDNNPPNDVLHSKFLSKDALAERVLATNSMVKLREYYSRSVGMTSIERFRNVWTPLKNINADVLDRDILCREFLTSIYDNRESFATIKFTNAATFVFTPGTSVEGRDYREIGYAETLCTNSFDMCYKSIVSDLRHGMFENIASKSLEGGRNRLFAPLRQERRLLFYVDDFPSEQKHITLLKKCFGAIRDRNVNDFVIFSKEWLALSIISEITSSSRMASKIKSCIRIDRRIDVGADITFDDLASKNNNTNLRRFINRSDASVGFEKRGVSFLANLVVSMKWFPIKAHHLHLSCTNFGVASLSNFMGNREKKSMPMGVSPSAKNLATVFKMKAARNSCISVDNNRLFLIGGSYVLGGRLEGVNLITDMFVRCRLQTEKQIVHEALFDANMTTTFLAACMEGTAITRGVSMIEHHL